MLHRAGKEGLGAAYRAAFAYLLERSDCRAIIQMDCDFSHDPADTVRLLGALERGADVAIGSRYVPGGGTPGWPAGRRHLSRAGSRFARTVLHLPVQDLTGGFKAWRADVLRSIDLSTAGAQGYGFQVEMTWRAHRQGAVIRELPIVFRERRAGATKMSRRIVAEALVMVLRLWFEQRRSGDALASSGLTVADSVSLGLMGRAGRVAVDDQGSVAVAGLDGPPGRGLTAHDARESEAVP